MPNKPETQTVEIYLVIDSDGDYEAAADLETAKDAYGDRIASDGAIRIIKLNLEVALPSIDEFTLKSTIPERKQLEPDVLDITDLGDGVWK